MGIVEEVLGFRVWGVGIASVFARLDPELRAGLADRLSERRGRLQDSR